jgi:putative ABC transport system permease protein
MLGMTTMILATLNERRREMAIMRSVGARPATILGLLTAEAGVLGVAGAGLGLAMLYGGLWAVRSVIDARFGLYIELGAPSVRETGSLALVIVAAPVAGLVPPLRAYRLSLSDGMMVRT